MAYHFRAAGPGSTYLDWNARSSSNNDEPRMRNTITPRTTGPTERPFCWTGPCTPLHARDRAGPSTQPEQHTRGHNADASSPTTVAPA